MSLTPEEKQRIYEEEKERLLAQEKVKEEIARSKEPKSFSLDMEGTKNQAAVLALFLLLAFGGGGYYFWAFMLNPSSPTEVLHTIDQVSGGNVTMAKYDQIREGMTLSEVEQVMGQGGEELSRVNVAGYDNVIYAWSNPSGANMNVTFQNGKVYAKAQFGLR